MVEKIDNWPKIKNLNKYAILKITDFCDNNNESFVILSHVVVDGIIKKKDINNVSSENNIYLYYHIINSSDSLENIKEKINSGLIENDIKNNWIDFTHMNECCWQEKSKNNEYKFEIIYNDYNNHKIDIYTNKVPEKFIKSIRKNEIKIYHNYEDQGWNEFDESDFGESMEEMINDEGFLDPWSGNDDVYVNYNHLS